MYGSRDSRGRLDLEGAVRSGNGIVQQLFVRAQQEVLRKSGV